MPGILCEHCTAVCCKYIALPIECPTTRKEFDEVRWFLIHQNVMVFVEDGDWYIAFQSTCRHLQPDNRCGIYETRPQICRDYTTDNCDYHSGDYNWDFHFTSAEHLDEFYQNVWLPRVAQEKSARRGGKKKLPKNVSGLKVRHGARLPSMKHRMAMQAAGAPSTDRAGVPLPVLGFGRPG